MTDNCFSGVLKPADIEEAKNKQTNKPECFQNFIVYSFQNFIVPVHFPFVSPLYCGLASVMLHARHFFHLSLFSLAPTSFGISPLPCPNIPLCTVYLSPGSFQKRLVSLSSHLEWRPLHISQQLVHFNISDCLELWYLNLTAAGILYFSHEGLFL